jgi:hypothetical protein
MTYSLRGIPDKLWDDIKRNAEMSGIPIRKYILLVLERNNVQFKIADPVPEDVSESRRKRKLERSYRTSE